ncbi:pleckstrin homology domain-containing family M member 1 isoform X1 [Thalassophryne amazonica]|uniref:pleckstrin homology domain-containing family M member 1 isoform X1 n=1 Tax=Thalassophryne amazonica TaxID=390379 RepID=UPI001470A7C0|nr:pleckstrin homology domain-containing family M member 1 isoform X1 [Thalassophryne amazonica]
MLATQSTDTPPEAKHVKQIKEKLVQSLKALQKRYITSDALVTSDDGDANLLCCALEALFIHGIKSKYIRSDTGSRSRKGERGLLPQPFFWGLLKTVTHGNVVSELEKLNFVSTDVGRCRAWLRLALNDGLLDCYLTSLFRENSKLRAHYQPNALLLNTEEREVLLSYLQGLDSLTFSLSYKSAVLNDWTTTPLALAGLCPPLQADTFDLPLNGGDPATTTCKESWDTVSQSSSLSDALDMQNGCPAVERDANIMRSSMIMLNSSNLSLATTGSSQLSSSLSSDGLLQGQDPRSPTGEQWSSCDLEVSLNISATKPAKDTLGEFRESGTCSQDSMREDSFVSSTGQDLSETAIFSSSDSETQGPTTPFQDLSDQAPNIALSNSEPQTSSAPQLSKECLVNPSPSDVCILASSEMHLHADTLSKVSDRDDSEETVQAVNAQHGNEVVEKAQKSGKAPSSESSVHQVPCRTTSILRRNGSLDLLSRPHSWISDDDIYKPHQLEVSDIDESPTADLSAPIPEPNITQSPPSVVHRRQIGLSNPFRGLLKLGHLERRGAVGIWRDYYCELSPFEFRLYLNDEERTCCDNCSLVRCEDARITSPEGRFELAFSGKRLFLRAANHDEAEDWVDRIIEAVNKCRPATYIDEQWVVLKACRENGFEETSVSSQTSAPSSPEQGLSSDTEQHAPPPPPPQEFDWNRGADLETDAIKEAVLYLSTDPEARTWTPLVFSLSLETLKGFQVQERRKMLRVNYSIEEIRDVVPDVSLGGPACFKILTIKETLRFRAESPEEARSWRALTRGALDSYLESGKDGGTEETVAPCAGVTGNLHRLVQHRLKEDGALLVHLYTVPSEKGLDAQSFKCAGCTQQIGPSRGRARLCEFSGQYYCDSCHQGDTTIIPARMVHNWDITQREVSRKALHLLAEIEHEPLLNLELLNPELVKHAEPMGQAHGLRQRLRLLGEYLLTCHSRAYKKLQSRIKQRTYLMESSHLYSVMDLRQIAEGHYVTYLETLVHYASDHVYHCDLCTQRGFICQMCHSDDIIFPFQFDSTTRCKQCKAVFHLTCKVPPRSCPRCVRMKKYLERDLQD